MTFNKNQLTFARVRQGYSKKYLAKALKVSDRAITAFEKGEYEPSKEGLQKISRTLNFPIAFFLEEKDIPIIDAKQISFRAASRISHRKKGAAACVAGMGKKMSEWIESRFETPKSDLTPFAEETDPENASAMLRMEWGLGVASIENIIQLLEAHGVKVFFLDEQMADIDAFSFWKEDVPFIFLNMQKSAERSRFDAAHELGHLVMHYYNDCSKKDIEKEANQFASAFLMPKESIDASQIRHPTLDDLIETKKQWLVSVSALAYRLHKLKKLTDWEYRTLCMHIASKGYRKSEPCSAPKERSKVLELVLLELWKDGITTQTIAKELNWDTHMVQSLILSPSAEEPIELDKESLKTPPDLKLV